MTALDEVGAILSRSGIPPSTIRTPPWTVFAVEVFLEKVLDLADPRVQDRLGTSLAELTGNWRYAQSLYLRGEASLPPAQLLGQIAYETGRIVGMRYHSAKNTGEGFGLVVFSDRLRKGRASSLEIYDPYDLIRQRLP